MRKLFAGLAVTMAALLPFGPTANAAEDTIRIPYAGSLSGPFVDFGERLFNGGVVTATADVNAAGGVRGKKLEFFKVDVHSPDTAKWISEYRLLCRNQDHPLLLFNSSSKMLFSIYDANKTCPMLVFAPTSGAAWTFPDRLLCRNQDHPLLLFNSSSKMLFSIYDANKTCPMLVFAPTSGAAWTFPDFGNIFFRYLPMPEKVLPAMYSKVKEVFGAKTVAISYSIDDEFSLFNMRIAKRILQEKGFEILTEQSSRMNETNFASQVAAIRQANPDIVVISHQPGDGGKIVRQLRDRGMKTQIVDGSSTVVGEDFWKLSEGTGKGAVGYSTYAATDPRPQVQNWIKKWQTAMNKPNEAPDAYVTATYDAILVLAKVLNEAKSLSREDLKNAFLGVRNMETISGVVSWNNAGDITRDKPVMVQVSDNGILIPWP